MPWKEFIASGSNERESLVVVISKVKLPEKKKQAAVISEFLEGDYNLWDWICFVTVTCHFWFGEARIPVPFTIGVPLKFPAHISGSGVSSAGGRAR
jgi:hypothetical protein